MTAQTFARLFRCLGYEFANHDLCRQALTHRSFGSHNYERLEFLGDSILGMVVTTYLYDQAKRASEGELSRMRASLVKQVTLAEIARELNLGEHLIMGEGELKSGGFDRDSILADTLEALIGSIYLDSDLASAEACVHRWFADRLSETIHQTATKDAKTRLQELVQARRVSLPRYEVVEAIGPDHERLFVVACYCDLLSEPVLGEAGARRAAEQSAASKALEVLFDV